jgi:hypothetical protein
MRLALRTSAIPTESINTPPLRRIVASNAA